MNIGDLAIIDTPGRYFTYWYEHNSEVYYSSRPISCDDDLNKHAPDSLLNHPWLIVDKRNYEDMRFTRDDWARTELGYTPQPVVFYRIFITKPHHKNIFLWFTIKQISKY